jgi:hypothetical protein
MSGSWGAEPELAGTGDEVPVECHCVAAASGSTPERERERERARERETPTSGIMTCCMYLVLTGTY